MKPSALSPHKSEASTRAAVRTPALWAAGWRWLLLCVALQVGGTHAQPSHTVPLAELQHAVGQRLPLRYDVAGLLAVDARRAQLRLLPDQNRLGATLALEATGPLLRRPLPGSLEVLFALRYEPSDRTVRAHQLDVRALKVDGMGPGMADMLQGTLPGLARDALMEVVLHTLSPQDLALPDTLGLRPDALTVTPEGLRIGFVPKR